MTIYLAGNVTSPREEMMIKYQADRLFSYFYHHYGGEFFEEFDLRINQMEKRRNEK